MVGAGAIPFALMGYIIANYRLDKQIGAQVRLNPVVLSTILGETIEDIQAGIDYLSKPDAMSTTPDEEGRRIVQVGQFDYRVVNGAKYDAIRNAEEKRQVNRIAKQRERAKATQPDLPGTPVKHGFQKPTFEEAQTYAFKIGFPKEKIDEFMNHYESNGWKVGRNPMRSWHSAMANWKLRNEKGAYAPAHNSGTGRPHFDRNKGTANEGHAERYAQVPAANQ